MPEPIPHRRGEPEATPKLEGPGPPSTQNRSRLGLTGAVRAVGAAAPRQLPAHRRAVTAHQHSDPGDTRPSRPVRLDPSPLNRRHPACHTGTSTAGCGYRHPVIMTGPSQPPVEFALPCVYAQSRMRPGPSSAIAVVDYSNVLPGRMDEDQPNRSVVRLRSIALSVARISGASHVILRLYGGWMMKGGHQSDAASRALLVATQTDPFPTPMSTGIVNGRFELATSLLSRPDIELPETYRIRGSVPRVRIRDGTKPADCVGESATCPAVILKRFTRSPRKLCPAENCSVTCEKAFVHNEQKMVDTHMASDILHAANSSDYQFVAIVSGDTDLIPPLLQAAQLNQVPIGLWPITGTMPTDFLDALSRTGVKIIEESVS